MEFQNKSKNNEQSNKKEADYQENEVKSDNNNKELKKNKSEESNKIENQENKDKEINKEKEKEKPKEKTLEEKYQEALDEIKKLKEKQMFIQAEMENTRKLMIKRMELAQFESKINTIREFLPIVESFESAIEKLNKNAQINSQTDIKSYLEGFKAVYHQFNQVFKGLGVKPIDKIGIPFNYKEHEVMMKFEDDSKPEDTVLQIIQKGWYCNDCILRPAKVVVSKKKEIPKEEPKKEEKDKKEQEQKTSQQNQNEKMN